jgi:ketosteroid isomerase-like protein
VSVNKLQALAQQLADPVDVPYRFDGKPLSAKYVNEAVAGLASASFGFPQPSFRVHGDTPGIVNAYDMLMGVTKDGKARSIDGRTTLVFIKQSGQWKIVSAHFSAIPRAL